MRHRPISEPLLTVEEVASLLRVSKKTILRRIASGEICAIRDGRLLRIRQDSLDAFVAMKSGNIL